jgi:hypothetical protein
MDFEGDISIYHSGSAVPWIYPAVSCILWAMRSSLGIAYSHVTFTTAYVVVPNILEFVYCR